MTRNVLIFVLAVLAVTRFGPTHALQASESSGSVRIQFVSEHLMEEWYPDKATAQLVLKRPEGEHVDQLTVDGDEIALTPHGGDTIVDLLFDTVPAVCRITSGSGGGTKFVARPGYCYVCLVTGNEAASAPEPVTSHSAPDPNPAIGKDESMNQVRNSINEEQKRYDSLLHQVNVLRSERMSFEEQVSKMKLQRKDLAEDKVKLLAVRDNLLILDDTGIGQQINTVRDATERQLKTIIGAIRSNQKDLAPLQRQLDRKIQETEAREKQLAASHDILESLKKRERVLRRE